MKIGAYIQLCSLKAALLYHHTNKGTTFCNGVNIETDKKTAADCFLFWKRIFDRIKEEGICIEMQRI